MSGRIGSYPAADSPADFGKDSEGVARRWHAEIEKALKEGNEWMQDCRRILARYKDQGPGRRGVGMDTQFGMRFNIFWSNVQTLAPSLYASTPQVVVERRWGDQDDLGRVACLILQRNAQYQLEATDFDGVMRSSVLDHLLSGRGTAWARYEPHFDRQPINVSLLPLPPPPPAPVPSPMMGVGGAPGGAPMPPPSGMPPGGAPPFPPTGAPPPPGMPGMPPPGLPGAPPGGPPVMPPPLPPAGLGAPPGPPGAPPPMMPPGMPPPAMLPPGLPPPGLGVPTHLLHVHIPTAPPGHPDDGALQIADDGEDAGEFIAYEEVKLDHVHWEDFLTSPARTWQEVRWVARRVYLTKAEGLKRFGPVFNDVPLDWHPRDVGETEALQPDHMLFRRAQVWEIWDKPSRTVIWIGHGYLEELLDQRDDPLRLSDFFPTPKPIFATLTTESLIPVPDYQLYRDQAVQIDTLTARIEGVTKAIKVAGVYDAAQAEIQRLFAEGVENQLIPVNQWGAFAQQGGLKGCIDLVDIGMLAEVLTHLVEVRAQAKQDLYEVTGISDIIRGSTAASETATAQQIKAGFGTMRLRSRQNEVARFARDLIRITCEIICEHFTPRVMLLVSDIQAMAATAPQDVALAPKAIQLLKDDKLRPLRIDIEADSTIMANHQQEQQSRIQFLTMAAQFLQQAVPAVQQTPEIAPLLGQMMLFGIRSFPQGAELEGAFEQAIAQMEQAAKQRAMMPQQAPPDPKLIVAQAQVRDINAKIQDRQLRTQADINDEDAKSRLAAMKAQVDKQRADDDNAARAVEAFHQREAEHRNFILEAAEAAAHAHSERIKAQKTGTGG